MNRMVSVVVASCLVLGACASAPQTADQSAAVLRQTAEINTQLGREYMVRGQYEVALEKLKKAVVIDPGYAPAHTVLAVLYEKIGESEFAEKHYRAAVKASPTNGDVNNNFGVFLCGTGRADQAERHFELAVDDPFYRTPAVALANAGACQLQAGNLDKALSYLRKSLEYDAVFADALLPMASINFRKNDYLRARAFLQRYHAVGPQTAASLLLGYRIEKQLGDRKAAAEYARNLQQNFADSEEVKQVRENMGS